MALAHANASRASMGQPVRPAQRASTASIVTKHALVSMGDVTRDLQEMAPATVVLAGEE